KGSTKAKARERRMKSLTRARNGNTSAPAEWNRPSVDQTMVEERAAAFAKRSIKTSAKLAGLKLAISMMDLTTLEGKDTPGKIAFLCRKAMQPLDPRYEVPSCAAVCVYPNMVRFAKKFLGNSRVKVASVATAFPTGLMPLRLKLQEVRSAAGDGADEIDMVIDRGAFLAGEHQRVSDEIASVKETLGDDWLTPDLFRFGASTLVNDVLMQIVKSVDGNYQGPDYFSLP